MLKIKFYPIKEVHIFPGTRTRGRVQIFIPRVGIGYPGILATEILGLKALKTVRFQGSTIKKRDKTDF